MIYLTKKKQFIILNSNLLFFFTYVVKDMYPDKRKKKDSWEVTVENVKKFPTPEAEKFHVGNRVLSLWLENEEWSSMFYEASVTAVEVFI